MVDKPVCAYKSYTLWATVVNMSVGSLPLESYLKSDSTSLNPLRVGYKIHHQICSLITPAAPGVKQNGMQDLVLTA